MDEMPTGRIFLKLAKVAAGSVYRAIGTKVASVCVYDSPCAGLVRWGLDVLKDLGFAPGSDDHLLYDGDPFWRMAS